MKTERSVIYLHLSWPQLKKEITDASCPDPRSSYYNVEGVERERNVKESCYGECVDFSILFYRDMIVC